MTPEISRKLADIFNSKTFALLDAKTKNDFIKEASRVQSLSDLSQKYQKLVASAKRTYRQIPTFQELMSKRNEK